ncbi:hypothetical protein cypCar_00027137, partial [Cyprinus carpio]
MISCVYVSRERERVSVAFSKPVHAQSEGLMLVLDGQPQQVEWRSTHPRLRHSPVWVSFTSASPSSFTPLCDLPPGSVSDISNEHNLTVHWTEKYTHRDCALYTGCAESWCRDSATDQELFRSELSVEKSSVLQAELQSCNQLLELEPQNKWCLLTIILLMRALDPLGHEKETLAHFQTLKTATQFLMRLNFFFVFLSLLTQNLTTLCHLDQLLLVTHINLSSNQLLRLPPQFAMLQCLEVLEADDNAIESLEGLYHLPKLEEVSLRNNRILFAIQSKCFIRNPFSAFRASAWFDLVSR